MLEHLKKLTEIDKIIHEPARLLIVSFLALLEEADFLFLLRETELTRGNLSSHLGKLENAGYVEVEKKFVKKKPQTIYRLTQDGHSALETYRALVKDALTL